MAYNEEHTINLELQRCKDGTILTQNLKESKDALVILDLLRKDLKEYFAGKKAKPNQSLIQRLKAYSHLLTDNGNALFAQIEKARTVKEMVDNTTRRDLGEGHVDNDRAVQEKLNTADVVGQRKGFTGDLEKDTFNLLDQLSKQIHDSMDNLTDNSIQSAYDFADYRIALEKETEHLEAEHKRKTAYLNKLKVDLTTATDYRVKCRGILDNAIKRLRLKIAECQHKSAYYAQENARRATELGVLKKVKAVFEERINNVKQYLKNRANDYEGDHKFDKTDLSSKRTDAQMKMTGEVRKEYSQTGGFKHL